MNQQETSTWDADAQNVERNSSLGPSEPRPGSSERLICSLEALTEQLTRQNQMLWSLLEQNAAMLEMLMAQGAEDDDAEPTYLDGTRIS